MGIWVKVENEQVLSAVAAGISELPEVAAQVLAEGALYHARVVEGSLPEAVKGKVTAEFQPTGAESMVVTYNAAVGTEGPTITSRSAFIPEHKMSSFTSRTPVVSPTGDRGFYLANVTGTGRGSIESYLQTAIAEAIPEADTAAAQVMEEKLLSDLRSYFESHNITFNAAVGRYQAGSGGATLPGGAFVPGGHFVVGAL